MNNFDKWLKYTEGLPSPQNYIEWSWRYIVAASLQRRVFLPPDHQPCFPNMYAILVGKAGIGKGLCIREVREFLNYWKLEDTIKLNLEGKTEEHKMIATSIGESDLEYAQKSEMQPKNKQNDLAKPPLIPMAADATTYEALVAAVAKSYRRIDYLVYDEKQQKKVPKVYGHSSICFALSELASLLRKRTDDTVNYLLGIYDCPPDYEYDTKTQGKDRVRRGCLNFFAGTTPDFMQEIFNAKLIDQGFGSRTFFLYANKDRKKQFFIPELTAEQLQYKKELLEHIRLLTTLYGKIEMDRETIMWLETWWERYEPGNTNPKLEGYYSRKKVHVMKTAIANHFSESLEMKIPLFRFQEAVEILAVDEVNMHLALVMETANPLSNLAKKILEYVKSKEGGATFVEIVCRFFDDASQEQMQEALNFLVDIARELKDETEKDEEQGKSILKYKIRK